MRADNHALEKLLFVIFGGIGTLFFVLGIVFAIAFGKVNKEDYVPTTATIVEIYRHNDDHKVYIDYSFEGQDYYNVRYGYYNSGMREGDQIEVLVNQYDPTSFYIGNFSLIFGLSFGGFGLIFMTAGIIPFVMMRKAIIREKKLREAGSGVWGVINGISQNYSVSVNKRHPYILSVKYEDEGIITSRANFQSKNVWIDDDPQQYIGKSIRVYIDAQDTNNYLVDIDSIGGGDVYGY